MAKYTLTVGDEQRTFWLYDPAPESQEPKPLVLAFHGSNHSGLGMSAGTGLNAHAKQGNFMVAYPDAPVGNWAEGCGCNNADRLQIPDLELVDKIIAQVGSTAPLDTDAIYAVGFSQGGLFAGRLACERSEVFAGVMVVAASMSVPLAARCNPAEPVNITFVQGILDAVLPYNGTDAGTLSLMSAPGAAAFWAHKNGLAVPAQFTPLPDELLTQVERTLYVNPQDSLNGRVALYSILLAGHVWPFGGPADANTLIHKMVRP